MASQPRWLSDEEQYLWRTLLMAARKVDRAIDDTLQECQGLSTSEFSVLVNLSEARGDALRLRDLCAALDWDRSRTSHQVTRMQRRGLVRKCRSEGDARGVMVVLTPEGRRRIEKAAPIHVESVRQLIFDHLTEQRASVLQEFCDAILHTGPGVDCGEGCD